MNEIEEIEPDDMPWIFHEPFSLIGKGLQDNGVADEDIQEALQDIRELVRAALVESEDESEDSEESSGSDGESN